MTNTFYLCDLTCRCKTLIIVLFGGVNSYILKGIDFFFLGHSPSVFVDTFLACMWPHLSQIRKDSNDE